jgi:hypothetical protein
MVLTSLIWMPQTGDTFSAVGDFDMCSLPNSGKKADRLLGLVNPVPFPAPIFISLHPGPAVADYPRGGR